MPKKKSGTRKTASSPARKTAGRKKSAASRKKSAASRKKGAAKRRPTLVPTGSYNREAGHSGSPPPPAVRNHDVADEGDDHDYHDDDPREKYMSVGDHLEELRVRILWMIGVLVVFSVAAGVFSASIHRFLIAPYNEITGERLLLYSVVGPMEVYIKVSFITGLATSLPVLIYILWGFVAPAVSRRAALLGNGIVLCSTVLFWTGMAVCWFYIFPLSLQFMFVEILPEGIAPQTTVEKVLQLPVPAARRCRHHVSDAAGRRGPRRAGHRHHGLAQGDLEVLRDGHLHFLGGHHAAGPSVAHDYGYAVAGALRNFRGVGVAHRKSAQA